MSSAVEGHTDTAAGLWLESFSKKYQRKYWYNRVTKQSVWIDPSISGASPTVPEKSTELNSLATAAASGTSTTVVTGKRSATSTAPAEKRAKVEAESVAELYEDSPFVAIERLRLWEQNLTDFAEDNSRFGKMIGRSKTAKACAEQGMRIGMQGLFARILWSQLLEQVAKHGDVGVVASLKQQKVSKERDAIFPIAEPQRDLAVEKELVEMGRSAADASDLLQRLSNRLCSAGRYLVALQQLLRHFSVRPYFSLSLVGDRVSYRNEGDLSVANAISNATIDPSKVYRVSMGFDGDALACIRSFAERIALRGEEVSEQVSELLQQQLDLIKSDMSKQGFHHYDIVGPHLNKLLRLYRMHTDSDVVSTDSTFVSVNSLS